MSRCCPHCGIKLPTSVDAFCPECREDLSETPAPPSLPEDASVRTSRTVSEIIGAEKLSPMELAEEIRLGGKLIVYQYCVSIVWITTVHRTKVHLVRCGESARLKGFEYSLKSLLVGWWGFPWGLFYTPMAILNNFSGGEDVTAAFIPHLPLTGPG